MIAPSKKASVPATVRVAIYTRKSVSEGLEQAFNTLDAQRESVEAYVKSQRGEGWMALPERYDDGGFTGANTDRPAFQRLMRDVEGGKVDVIAVYKIDRLSRSLADFAQLMQLFERRGVTFVSVTQSFCTTNSMGRLTLNILMSFAEFERETIAERTRDKIAATRRRGMWTGGRPVLGYDVVEKRLVVNEEEAERVRAIFALYEELGSAYALAAELRSRGWTTKAWQNKAGSPVAGRAFTKASVRCLLKNPLYLGKIRCGDEVAEGAHPAIIDEGTWEKTQALLQANAVKPARRGWRPSRAGALLQGLLRCACGSSMTYHFTQRGERRYGYYVCMKQQKENAEACPKSRAPAGKLEAFVVEQIRRVGRDPSLLEATLAADGDDRESRRLEFEAEVRRLGHERGRLETERRNVVEAIEQGGASLVGRLTELDGQLAGVAERQQEAKTQLAALDRGAIDPEGLRQALEALDPLWNQLVPKERARVLALLVEGIVFYPQSGDVEITFRPGGPRAVSEVAR